MDGAANSTQQQSDIVQPSLGRLSKKYESQESYVEEIKEIYNRLGVELDGPLYKVWWSMRFMK